MPSSSELLAEFLDTLTAHLALAAYLLAVTDERAVWRRLRKLPFLLLSPAITVLLSFGLNTVPVLGKTRYYIASSAILMMCTLWVWWAWPWGFWQAFAATCMAGIFQMAESTLSRALWDTPLDESNGVLALYLAISIAAALLLYRLRFGRWFRLLLDNSPTPQRLALLLFALEVVTEMLFRLSGGVRTRSLAYYYLLAAALVVLITVLIVHLAKQFDDARKMQAQQDVIIQQRLYEQDLEIIRREVRAFRHDYKNLLAGLSLQAGEGELEGLRHTLSELDAGFDQRLGKKIQASAQIGNLQLPEVRSLLLSKLTVMRERGIDCRLEIPDPVVAVDMDVWDFVRCLGILIDNAIEAASDTEQPWVEILLLAQERQVFFRVSNPYKNAIEPGKMWDDGWSTKGAGRGVGLSSYQRVLENYPNTSTGTSWANGIFTQEMTIEGRP